MAAKKKSAKAAAKIAFVESMECLPVTKLPEGAQWSYEIKLDGYRRSRRRARSRSIRAGATQ
jgi:ATP-dependent DNA ligase